MRKIYIQIAEVSEKEIWVQLMADVYDANLISEFSDFYLEHPDMSIVEIDREFRAEWDI